MGRAESFLKRNMRTVATSSRSPSSPIDSVKRQSPHSHGDSKDVPAWAKSIPTKRMPESLLSVKPRPHSPSHGRQRNVLNPIAAIPLPSRKTSIGGVVAACLLGVGVFAWIANQSEQESGDVARATTNWPQLHTAVRGNVFAVASKDGLGSAFAVSDRDLLTNRHVVEKTGKGAEVKILHQDWRQPRSARVRNISRKYDLAWIVLDQPLATGGLQIEHGDSHTGDDVFAEGYPGYAYKIGENALDNLEVTQTTGRIKAENRSMQGTPCYETDATINSGNSGGPLLNGRGRVIGVNTWGIDSVENSFFAIKIEEVKRALPLLWDKIHGRDISDVYEFTD